MLLFASNLPNTFFVAFKLKMRVTSDAQVLLRHVYLSFQRTLDYFRVRPRPGVIDRPAAPALWWGVPQVL